MADRTLRNDLIEQVVLFLPMHINLHDGVLLAVEAMHIIEVGEAEVPT